MTQNKELFTLAEYAFHKNLTGGAPAFDKLLSFARPYTQETDGRLSSMVLDIPFEIYWGRERLPMAGIGYVASYPEVRGTGGVRVLMTQLLRDEYARGTALSYLSPFSYAFYRRFGYEYALDRKLYQLSAADFPAGDKGSGLVKRQSLAESLSALTEVHRSADNQGSLVRTPELWDYYFALRRAPYFAVYYEGARPLGYLIYEMSRTTFEIVELLGLTAAAKKALHAFVHSHAGSFERINYRTTLDARLEEEMGEPSRLQIQVLPDMMARIVNLDSFLAVNGQPNFAARIHDPILEENNRTIGRGDAVDMTIGAFTARILREQGAILREDF